MTSLYPHQNGMTGLAHRGWHLTDYSKTLVAFLNDQGYHTALMGESHITPYDETEFPHQNRSRTLQPTRAVAQ